MLALLAGAALRSLFLAAVVGIGLRLRRISNPRVAFVGWTLVLATSLVMPLAMRLTSIALPHGMIAVSIMTGLQPLFAPESSAQTAASLLYFAVFGALMLRLLAGVALSWRITRAATLIREDWTGGLDVRVSPSIDTPATFGSVILVPADHTAWVPARQLAVLAHEGAHVARRDFAIQLTASVNRAVFWFNPLSWWLRRHLADLAEAASDDVAIVRLNDRFGYAEILLEIAGRVPGLPSTVAMARRAAVALRVERILSGTSPSADLSRHGRAMLAACIVPLAVLLALLIIRPAPPPAQSPLAAGTPGAMGPDPGQAVAGERAAGERAAGELAARELTARELAAGGSAAGELAAVKIASSGGTAIGSTGFAPPDETTIATPAMAPTSAQSPRTEAASLTPPFVAPAPPAQAARSARAAPSLTGNGLAVAPARAMRQPGRAVSKQAVADQPAGSAAAQSMAARSHAPAAPNLATEDGQSALFKRVVNETCTGSFVAMLGGAYGAAARLYPVQAHFFRGPGDTPWVSLYLAPRQPDKLPVTINGSEIRFTTTQGANYTLSPSDDIMSPARYHHLTGSALHPHGDTIDFACGVPKGHPL